MSTVAAEYPVRDSGALRTIALAGLIAGILDITGACVVSWLRAGVRPVVVLQSVASGLYGPASYTGGTKTAVIGLLLHFFIATTWATVYFFASRKLSFLLNQALISGILYGVVVYLFMNFVVIPLSAITRRPVPLSGRLIGMSIIIVCIGIPIALIVSSLSNKRS